MPWDTGIGWEDDSCGETKEIIESNPFYCPHCGSDECVPPSGNVHSDVLFIGEFPGEEELQSGKPFVGKTGRLLKEELRKIGLSLHNYRLCNLWQHEPNKKNKECFERGVKICLEEAKGKRMVVLIGSDTVKYFTGKKVSEWNGLLIDSSVYLSNPYVMVMVQPATAYHGGVGETRFALQQFKKYLEEQNA